MERIRKAKKLGVTEVVKLAKLMGWVYYHTYDSRRSEPGFPDLVLVKDRVLYRELKTETGRLSGKQKAWGERLRRAGQSWEVWRPSQMREIFDVLTKKEG